MEFYSTNNPTLRYGLREAVTRGIAPDGGLFVPCTIPRLPRALFNNIAGMDLRDIAYVVTHSLFNGDLAGRDLQAIVRDSLTFDIPLHPLDHSLMALELFHGPTMTFKDIGTRFMARLISRDSRRSSHVNVVVATSGDTGGAVANGFYGVPGIDVWVLYPLGTLDRAAEAQFTTLGGNIHPIGINASIDECREIARQVLTDGESAERYHLVTANSINVARLLPQTIYYFHAYGALQRLTDGRAPDPVIAVPAGNLGNLTAGIIAERMGLPVKRFIAVNNHNDAFSQFLSTGCLDVSEPRRTLAEAMDVGDPSNLPRLITLFDGDHRRMQRLISGTSISDDRISATINHYAETRDYLLDPHSAAACAALADGLQPGEVGIFHATAHPAKFKNVVEMVTGRRVPVPEQYLDRRHLPRHHDRIAPDADSLRRYIHANCRTH